MLTEVIVSESPRIVMIHGDCMEYMATLEPKAFELAIVDPPYGGGQNFNFRYGNGSEVYANVKPRPEYWDALFGASENQIVWGGNYFAQSLPENRCWISWYKGQPISSFSDFELAWTSFDRVAQAVSITSYGFNHADKKQTGVSTIHPTQKPIKLYKWLLKNYAKEGDRILDTHGGSFSSAIACYDMGFDFVGIEKDIEYFEKALDRVQRHIRQERLELV